MRNKKRKLPYLLSTILSFIIIILIVLFISPAQSLNLFLFKLKASCLIFIPLAVFFYSLPIYILKSKKHGVLLSLFVIGFLLFRVSGLTHPLFTVLLLALFLTLELLFTSKQA